MRKLIALFVILGSLDAAAQQGQAWDARFRAIPEARNIGEYVRIMSARPHHLGSPYGKQNAEWILARFKEWGWDAQIENYDVLFPTPKERIVEMVEPSRFRLALEEPPVRFAVGHRVEHRIAYELSDFAQPVLDVCDQVWVVRRARHGAGDPTVRITGSQMSGCPSTSNVL